jgi:hypothetical protein
MRLFPSTPASQSPCQSCLFSLPTPGHRRTSATGQSLDVKTPDSTETPTPADAFRRANAEINSLILALEKIGLLLATAGGRRF